MKRVNKIHAPTGMLVLVFLFLTVFVTSCGSDDPAAPADANKAPGAPAIATTAGAPADGATDVALDAVLRWTCSDPDDDPLTYTVMFGTAAQPPAVAQDQVAASYTPAALAHGTTYHWQITAQDDGGKTASSPVWSFATAAAPTENVTSPTTPTGDDSGYVGSPLSFSVTGGMSDAGHALEYRFDWDDGSTSAWTTTMPVTHAWTAAGTYVVTAQARCIEHPTAVSVASTSLTVAIVVGETVSTPDPADGPTSIDVGVSGTYNMSGAVSSEGHAVEYRVDWGDGVIDSWIAGSQYTHVWSEVGTYDVMVQARCSDHPDVLSAWSAAIQVTTSLPAETVTAPPYIDGPASGGAGESIEFETYNSGSSLSHALEYRFDWGDGTYSTWGPTVAIYYRASHVWAAAGTYDVRAYARCVDHPDVMSGPSSVATIEITDTEVLTPPLLSSVSEFTLDLGSIWASYLSGASSNFGHTLEYQVDWGDGDVTDWSTSGNAEKRWYAEGDFTARARVRCQDHPDLVSDWSGSVLFHIIDLESIDGIGTLAGPNTATVGVPNTYTVSGFTSSFGHDLEYQLYDGYSESVPGVGQGWVSADNLTMTWGAPGQRVLTVGARCVDHPEIEKLVSYRLWVTISDGP